MEEAESEETLRSIDEMIDRMSANHRENMVLLGRIRVLPDGSTLTLSDEAWEAEQARRMAEDDGEDGDEEYGEAR